MNVQECQHILAGIPTAPPLRLPDQTSKPLGQGTICADSLDLDALVAMRYQHQTRHAAKAVCTPGSKDVATDLTTRQKEESVRRQLIKQFHAVLKEQQAQGAGTGVERVVCWRPGDTQPVNSAGLSIHLAPGNVVNAAEVASQTAKKVLFSYRYIYCIFRLLIKSRPIGS